jgi:hypothetical protein
MGSSKENLNLGLSSHPQIMYGNRIQELGSGSKVASVGQFLKLGCNSTKNATANFQPFYVSGKQSKNPKMFNVIGGSK